MAKTRYITPDGTTVEVITMSMCSREADNGDWLVARLPNGKTHSTPDNPRGWVRTIKEIAGLGIDLATLEEAS